MLINELFTQTFNYYWGKEEANYKYATFVVDSGGGKILTYRVMFEYYTNTSPPKWEVSFACYGRGDPWGINNAKNSAKVFSTVIAVIKDFARTHPQTFIRFTAKEDSRRSLYQALAKRLAPNKHWITHPDDPDEGETYIVLL